MYSRRIVSGVRRVQTYAVVTIIGALSTVLAALAAFLREEREVLAGYTFFLLRQEMRKS